MIRLVIFDISNVCYNLEEPSYLKAFAARHDLDYRELDKQYQALLVLAEMDEFGGKEVWRRVLEHFGIEEDIDGIIEGMIALKQEMPETLALVKALRAKVKTAYFTNYNRDYWAVIAERFDLEPYFDWGLVSYQAKTRKPAPEGFRIILEHFGVKPEEVVFTDDSAANLVEAAKLGINTIHFTGVEKLKEELAKLGVSDATTP